MTSPGFLWACRLALAIGLCGVTELEAHDPGFSGAEGKVTAAVIELTVGFAPADAQRLLPSVVPTSTLRTPQEFERARLPLAGVARVLWEVRAGEQAVAPTETHVELVANDSVNFRCVYPRPVAGRLSVRAAKLAALPPGHRQFVFISDEHGATLAGKLLSAKDDRIDLVLEGMPAHAAPVAPPVQPSAVARAPIAPPPPPTSSAFLGFLRLGVEHIWTGYDHILFLIALLVACRSARSIAAIITCFTLAHSLTLALATLDLVKLPARITEPAIAASIVFVGAENLLRRGAEPPWRWLLTFVFGLVHGFGFASVLRERGVGAGGQGAALPLFSFNLGVELGQIAIAGVVLPLLWRARRREWFMRHGVAALSAVVAVAGVYWFLERTVFDAS